MPSKAVCSRGGEEKEIEVAKVCFEQLDVWRKR